MSQFIIKMAHVESIEDDADGLRIKARLSQDGLTATKDLPYLLSKCCQRLFLLNSLQDLRNIRW